MAIIVRDDIILDNAIVAGLGIKGKNLRYNTRGQTAGGFGQVNIGWKSTLRQYEVGTVPARPELWKRFEGLFEVTDFGAYGFLMLDPKDQRVSAGEGLLQPLARGVAIGTAGSGFGVPTYQIVKRYTALGTTRTHDRSIKRPLSPVILRGVTPAAPTLSLGVATFAADASQVIASITPGAATVLNFANGAGIVAAMGVGERVFVDTLGGTAGAALNGLSHVVSAKGAASLTITSGTVGLTGTGGTAARYPQALEALTWSGVFYVPVQFMDDFVDWELVRPGPADTRLMVGPSVMLQEVRE